MKFSYYDLGSRSGGEIVELTLSGNAANVFLVDSSNFSSYKAGRRYTYFGGHAKQSPVRLQVPRAGHWYLVIDLGGYGGSVRHSMQILPGALQPLRDMPLASIPSLVQSRHDEMGSPVSDERDFDVFISHASEDKAEVARPLADALQDGSLRVWYDEFELRIGDSLRRKIDTGLARSRFGVVILSKSFFAKGWTNYELDGLVTRAVSGDQVILPIWHNITKQELINYSPSLADKLARSTGTHTIEEIAAEIIDVIRNAK
jgi:hypothetical protein